MKEKIYAFWLRQSIKQKMHYFTLIVFVILCVSIGFNILVGKKLIFNYKQVFEENSQCVEIIQALEDEKQKFYDYIRSKNPDNYYRLCNAINRTDNAFAALDCKYNAYGENQYAKVWSIKNLYEVYSNKRNNFIVGRTDDSNYISFVYELYDIQEYLNKYAHDLMYFTVNKGNEVYRLDRKLMVLLPILSIIISVLFFIVFYNFAAALKNIIVKPIEALSESAKQITENNFDIEDVVVPNKDEVGYLVEVFNKMKYSYRDYICAIEESKIKERMLQEKEMERVAMEHTLRTTQLELLQSQINPHFLFNTLNVIAGMANIEDAETTEKMIRSLSDLFRYNLKTTESFVPVRSELKVANDYLYLQKMRFGQRIEYVIDCRVDADVAEIPTFLLQPLIENAIIHGISKKEEGGKIKVRIWNNNEYTNIVVIDNGIGISKEKIKELMTPGDNSGIGLGNIVKRVTVYQNGYVKIFSLLQKGTVVKVMVPIRKDYFDDKYIDS